MTSSKALKPRSVVTLEHPAKPFVTRDYAVRRRILRPRNQSVGDNSRYHAMLARRPASRASAHPTFLAYE